jgi:diguanylate cyclase (GGDEF)-like protein
MPPRPYGSMSRTPSRVKGIVMPSWTQKHPTITLLLSGLLVALIGIADYVTRFALSFAALYLLPVVLVTRTLGWEIGVLMGIACVTVGAGADFLAGRAYAHVLWEFITNASIFGVVVVVLGKLQQALEQEQRLAQHDPLTGLVNRGAFYEQAADELVRCRRYHHPFTIAYIDCDNFKAINDRLGHQTGDALLCAVATILQRSVRTSDIVARLGGDEFIIGFVETGSDAALTTVQRMCESLHDTMEQRRWPVTFSIGVATFTSPPASVDVLIDCADQLMYAAKQSGKNAVRHAVIEAPACSNLYLAPDWPQTTRTAAPPRPPSRCSRE